MILPGTIKLLCIRRGGHILSLHEVRPSVHICSVHHHPHGAGRGAQEGLRDALRGSVDGTGFPWQHRLPKQTRSGESTHNLFLAREQHVHVVLSYHVCSSVEVQYLHNYEYLHN